MLDQTLAEAMQRVLEKGSERATLTQVLKRLVEDAGIGTKRGKSVYFTAKDREDMRDWLSAKGYALAPVDKLADMPRGDRLAFTPNEKASRGTIKRNRIAIKALAGQDLLLGNDALRLPAQSHLDVDWATLTNSLGHRAILLVENYENFNLLHKTRFRLPAEYQNPLVVYRGDPQESRLDAVQGFIERMGLPVMAFMDLDPAGMLMASQIPTLVGVIAPELDVLNEQLASPVTGRKDLFQAQYPGCKDVLQQMPADSPCKPLWRQILIHQAGVVQERWIHRTLSLHQGTSTRT